MKKKSFVSNLVNKAKNTYDKNKNIVHGGVLGLALGITTTGNIQAQDTTSSLLDTTEVKPKTTAVIGFETKANNPYGKAVGKNEAYFVAVKNKFSDKVSASIGAYYPVGTKSPIGIVGAKFTQPIGKNKLTVENKTFYQQGFGDGSVTNNSKLTYGSKKLQVQGGHWQKFGTENQNTQSWIGASSTVPVSPKLNLTSAVKGLQTHGSRAQELLGQLTLATNNEGKNAVNAFITGQVSEIIGDGEKPKATVNVGAKVNF